MKIIQVLIASICFAYSCTTKPQTIALQPLGTVEAELITQLQGAIEEYYQINVVVMPQISVPQEAYINVKKPRYRADKLLAYLSNSNKNKHSYVLGITNVDISTTKKNTVGAMLKPASKYYDWGVMGLGYMPGKSCIVSTFRLRCNRAQQFNDRCVKVAIHELGHNQGLPHCNSNKLCVMSDAAETVATIDRVEKKLCNNCFQKLR